MISHLEAWPGLGNLPTPLPVAGDFTSSVPPSFSLCGTFHKATLQQSSVNEWSKREQSRSQWPRPWVTHHHFCLMLLVTQTNPDTMWEGTIQRCEYQEGENHRGPSWSWLPYASIESSLWVCEMLCVALWEGENIYFCYVLWQKPWFHIEFQQH